MVKQRGASTAFWCILLVIAVFVAVFFINPNPGRRRGPLTCQTNLKQLGIGLVQYIQDYDQQYPLAGPHGTGWAGALYPYEKSQSPFACPDSPEARALKVDGPKYPLTYAMNSNFVKLDGAREVPLRLDETTSAATTVIVFETEAVPVDMSQLNEGGTVSPTGYHSGTGNGIGPVTGGSNGKQIRYSCGVFGGRQPKAAYGQLRHDPSAIYLAADGHTKILRPKSVSTGQTPAASSAQRGDFAASTDKLDSGVVLTFSTR
ncbi:MAG TPA: hypothetical protein VGK19_17485 [Capsulimonadaceae bacterium]|jgi:hypothetical protein